MKAARINNTEYKVTRYAGKCWVRMGTERCEISEKEYKDVVMDAYNWTARLYDLASGRFCDAGY